MSSPESPRTRPAEDDPRAWPNREGRYGIQQLNGDGLWTSCTIWCGYEHAADAIADAERNATTEHEFRVFHRSTGDVVADGRAR
jgi:hypothetical protein